MAVRFLIFASAIFFVCGQTPNTLDKDNLNKQLLEASKSGSNQTVESLLNRGADPNYKDDFGRTSLTWATRNSRLAIINLVLQKGAQIDSADEDNWTALYWACAFNQIDAVITLLEKKANVHIANVDGWTPLHIASANGYPYIVQLLLDSGANFHSRNKQLKSSLDLAIADKREATIKVLEKEGERKRLALAVAQALQPQLVKMENRMNSGKDASLDQIQKLTEVITNLANGVDSLATQINTLKEDKRRS